MYSIQNHSPSGLSGGVITPRHRGTTLPASEVLEHDPVALRNRSEEAGRDETGEALAIYRETVGKWAHAVAASELTQGGGKVDTRKERFVEIVVRLHHARPINVEEGAGRVRVPSFPSKRLDPQPRPLSVVRMKTVFSNRPWLCSSATTRPSHSSAEECFADALHREAGRFEPGDPADVGGLIGNVSLVVVGRRVSREACTAGVALVAFGWCGLRADLLAEHVRAGVDAEWVEIGEHRLFGRCGL